MVSGYKQTDIGLIPEEWEVKQLIELTMLMTNGFVGTAKTHYSNNDNAVLYIQGYNVIENGFNYHGIKRVTREFHNKHKKSNLKTNDLLTVQTGEVGLTTIVPSALEGSNCHALIISRFKPNICASFFSYFLNSKSGQTLLKTIETGTTMKHINVGDMKYINVPLPPLPEQEAIAEVLSDTDELIGALEKRIAKKQLMKQGAMQTLLTPKVDWEVKKLGEIGETYGGLSGKSKKDFEDGNYPYIPFMNIMSNPIIDKNYVDFVNIKKGEIHNKALKGDLFFNGSSETPEEVGMCSILMNDIPNLYLNSFCFGFRFYKTTNENGLFFVYYFRSNEGRKHFRLLAQGATRYNLSKTQLLKMEIPFPPIQEQNRIATILSDMDNEIDALEKKLSKTKELKQGLMQQLLTGKIRLV